MVWVARFRLIRSWVVLPLVVLPACWTGQTFFQTFRRAAIENYESSWNFMSLIGENAPRSHGKNCPCLAAYFPRASLIQHVALIGGVASGTLSGHGGTYSKLLCVVFCCFKNFVIIVLKIPFVHKSGMDILCSSSKSTSRQSDEFPLFELMSTRIEKYSLICWMWIADKSSVWCLTTGRVSWDSLY